jgi:hypothetical protein
LRLAAMMIDPIVPSEAPEPIVSMGPPTASLSPAVRISEMVESSVVNGESVPVLVDRSSAAVPPVNPLPRQHRHREGLRWYQVWHVPNWVWHVVDGPYQPVPTSDSPAP